MRIALVYAHFNLTGSLPRQQVELARYLVAAGHDVHLYLYRPDSCPELAPEATVHEVPATPAATSRLGLPLHVATFARNATIALRRDRAAYDVVHSRGMSAWAQDIAHVTGVVDREIGRARTARGAQPGVVGRLKDAALPATAPIVLVRRALERRIFVRQVPLEVHTSSRLIRDDVISAYDVDPARIRVVVPGVSLEEFRAPVDREAARRAVDVEEDTPLILFCGHSWERKGLDLAIRALARMHEPAHLLVVGSGDIDRYRAFAHTAGVAGQVTFTGPRSDTWRYFQAADVFVLPTRVDMWGMTVAEAMASEVPPVTTSAAGAADVIEDGRTGFVLPEPLDVDLLASTCDRLLGDPELRRRIGRAAAVRARALTWEEHGRQVEDSMRNVAERRPRSAPSA